MTTLPGLDVSAYQGAIGWPAVAAAGYRFAWIKATEGTGYTDPQFRVNWHEAAAWGLVRGAYHVARPDLNEPEAEADYFLATVGMLAPGDLLALDCEEPLAPAVAPDDWHDWALAWLRRVEARAGFLPLLYSRVSFMRAHNLTGHTDLADYGLWLAAYAPTPAIAPDPWPFWAFCQYTSAGSVPGIAGPVDLDTFNGDEIQLRRYGLPPPPDHRVELVAELRGIVAAAKDDALRAAVRRADAEAKLRALGAQP